MKEIDKIYQEVRLRSKWLTPKEIKHVRIQYSLTQVEFAELLSVSYGTYKNWEIGHRVPTTPAMALLYVARDYPEIFLKNKGKFRDKSWCI